MYGTVARLRIKPGMEERLQQMSAEAGQSMTIPGFVFQYVYQSDNDPQELFLVVAFESQEAYRANASSPEQHQRYLEYSQMIEAEPEWHDGKVIFSWPAPA